MVEGLLKDDSEQNLKKEDGRFSAAVSQWFNSRCCLHQLPLLIAETLTGVDLLEAGNFYIEYTAAFITVQKESQQRCLMMIRQRRLIERTIPSHTQIS